MSFDAMIQLGLAIMGFLSLTIFNDIRKSIDKLMTSVESLNEKMAVICERVDSHEKRISRIEGG